MDQHLGIHILLVGDTARWREQTKSALPAHYCIRVRSDYVGAIEALMEGPKFNLCIMANKISERDDGLRIVQELQEDGDPQVILYTREISDHSRTQAEKLGAIVIDMGNTEALCAAVKTLIEI